ncbi:MAG: MFS transporter [Hyphomicrobiaceae bacterium]|nr:MAG: MFS transporter [Hyphomicrobiaceae bacterium]
MAIIPRFSLSTTRRLAAGLTGYCVFLNLYAPQAILPLLSNEFGAGPADIAHIMTASTVAVALTAPFTGTIADVLGRKRVIVAAMLGIGLPTLMSALAPTLEVLMAWRFVQGLLLPPVFAVMIAYISEEMPPDEAASTTGVFISGSSLGGFTGRFLTGILADVWGWRPAFVVLTCMSFLAAIIVMLKLPRERQFVRSSGFLEAGRQMVRHLANPQLLATFAVGFGVLFNFMATFTYVSFHLAAAPFLLSASALGAIFATFLTGSIVTPWVGRGIEQFGRKNLVLGVIVIWCGGIALTLVPSLLAVIVGLAVAAGCGMLCQATSTGYVALTAQFGRSSAVGLYVTSFYVGGSFGAALGGVAWTLGRWPACAMMMMAMLAIMLATVAIGWSSSAPQTPRPVERD